MSAAGSAAAPRACSGAMYSIVPSIWPSGVGVPRSEARPRSSNTARPSGVIKMLVGLTSRWILPARWSAPRASAIWRTAGRSLSSSNGTSWRRVSASHTVRPGAVSSPKPPSVVGRSTTRRRSASGLTTWVSTSTPSTSSMVKKQRLGSANSSPRRTRLGWWTSRSERNSLLRRSTESPDVLRIILSATGLRTSRSNASYTTPMPPSPTTRVRRKRPSASAVAGKTSTSGILSGSPQRGDEMWGTPRNSARVVLR